MTIVVIIGNSGSKRVSTTGYLLIYMSKRNSQQDRYACLFLSFFFDNPPFLLKRLLEENYTPRDIFSLSSADSLKILGEKRSRDYPHICSRFNPTVEFKRLAEKQIGFVAYTDEQYPLLLKHISDPPVGLYYKGRFEKAYFDKACVAVVGTRKPSSYGTRYARHFSRLLCRSGVTIVSGMAIGIDTEAHEGALEVGGPTVAVLAGSVNYPYPPQNRGVYERIIRGGGVVISEMPPATKVEKWHFVVRNRIVSGLSRGVFVVEGAVKSGSLITARLALKEGRDVWVLPGNINNINTQAPLLLLKEAAAYPVTSPDDILQTLGINQKNREHQIPPDMSKLEHELLRILQMDECAVDDLFIQTKAPLQALQQSLLTLEMRGIIKKTPTGMWAVQ